MRTLVKNNEWFSIQQPKDSHKRIKRMMGNKSHLWWIVIAVIIVSRLIFTGLNLKVNLLDLHSFRQTQTAFTIKEYMAGNWSLASPMPVLGPPWQAPFEFPLFQALASLVGILFNLTPDLAARTTGLFSLGATGLLLGVLLRRWYGYRVSVFAVLFFMWVPFSLQWGSSSLIEFTATAMVIGAIIAIDSYSRKPRWTLIGVATVLLSAGFAIKVTTAIAWGLVFLVAALGSRWRNMPSTRQLVSGFLPLAVALGAGLLWTSYADSVKEENPIGAFLTSDSLREWNFGTLSQRLVVDNWLEIAGRIPSMGAGLIGFLGLALFALRGKTNRIRTLAILSAIISAPLVFFNLYFVHDYYLSAVFPAFVAILSIGTVSIADTVVSHLPRVNDLLVTILLAALLLGLSWESTESQRLKLAMANTPGVPPISEGISRIVPRDAGVMVVGCDWDPTPLYYADRKGLSLPGWFSGEIPETWFGYELTYLAFCSYSGFQQVDGDPAQFLPWGVQAVPVEGEVGMFKLIRGSPLDVR